MMTPSRDHTLLALGVAAFILQLIQYSHAALLDEPCDVDNDCEVEGATCNNSVCTCPGGGETPGAIQDPGDWEPWSNWRLRQWNCEWSRTRWFDGDVGQLNLNGQCGSHNSEHQTMNCTCDTEDWTNWIPVSDGPCLEARSRGEIRTKCSSSGGPEGPRKREAPPASVTQCTEPGIPCYETRPCESRADVPCEEDNPVVQAYVELFAPNVADEEIRNIKEWASLCIRKAEAPERLRFYIQCTADEAEPLFTNVSHCFYTEMCDTPVLLMPEIQTMLDDPAFDQAAIYALDFSLCLELANSESNPELQQQLRIASFSCMRDVIENAGFTEPNDELARLMAQFLIDCEAVIDDLGPTSEFYDFRSPRCSMRLYGDPHVETCNDTTRQTTCAAPGRQTYLDIFFLRITGVNTQRRASSLVTVLTEVDIEFKSLVSPHAVTARYLVSSGALPATFQSQAASIAAIDVVDLQHAGNRVRLIWPHTGVIIIISGKSIYQFTMRASQAVMNTGTGILIEGCPPGQALGRRRRRESKRAIGDAAAEAACLTAGVPINTPEMEACIIDVTVTDDFAIVQATADAIADNNEAVGLDTGAIQDAGVWSINIFEAIDGGWTDWSPWTRWRTCTNPTPAHGGADCLGPDTDTCGPGGCPVHGGWSEWGPWICDVMCGAGTATRVRTCTDPSPQNGGAYCVGHASETQACYRSCVLEERQGRAVDDDGVHGNRNLG